MFKYISSEIYLEGNHRALYKKVHGIQWQKYIYKVNFLHRNAGHDKKVKRKIEAYNTFCIVYHKLLGIFMCLGFIFTLTFHIISNMIEYISKVFIGTLCKNLGFCLLSHNKFDAIYNWICHFCYYDMNYIFKTPEGNSFLAR